MCSGHENMNHLHSDDHGWRETTVTQAGYHVLASEGKFTCGRCSGSMKPPRRWRQTGPAWRWPGWTCLLLPWWWLPRSRSCPGVYLRGCRTCSATRPRPNIRHFCFYCGSAFNTGTISGRLNGSFSPVTTSPDTRSCKWSFFPRLIKGTRSIILTSDLPRKHTTPSVFSLQKAFVLTNAGLCFIHSYLSQLLKPKLVKNSFLSLSIRRLLIVSASALSERRERVKRNRYVMTISHQSNTSSGLLLLQSLVLRTY